MPKVSWLPFAVRQTTLDMLGQCARPIHNLVAGEHVLDTPYI